MLRPSLADLWARRQLRGRLQRLLALVLGALSVLQDGTAGESSISYAAIDQEAATLIAAFHTLSGENYQADIDLLVAGINATRGCLRLVHASPAGCRQALAFALDCWWMRGTDGSVMLTSGKHLPRGKLEVRTITSTLRRQPALQPMIEQLLAPWLGGQAGISYLPADGLWTATLDSDGHSRLIEILSLCERPIAQAIGRIADPDLPDFRRITTVELSVRTWPALVEGLGEAMQVSVALSARLALRNFPLDVIKLPRMRLSEVVTLLHASGISAHWSHGVLCLGEDSQSPSQRDREHPAQRRRMALIPIGHLVANVVEGNMLVATIRQHVRSDWWSLPGAGIEYLSANGALLVAGDVDVQKVVLDAVTAIDTLGLEFGLAAIAASANSPAGTNVRITFEEER